MSDQHGRLLAVAHTANAGKDTHARAQKLAQPEVTEIRTWGAYERIAVRRG
jgi:hypothetical protein